MKVLGIVGSPRRNGNTDRLLAELLIGAASRGAEVKTTILKKLAIEPCRHCDGCIKAGHCVVNDDMQQVYEELKQADVIVLASPVQFMGVTAHLKAMIDRGQAMWARKYQLKLPPLDSAPVAATQSLRNPLVIPALADSAPIVERMRLEKCGACRASLR